MLFDSYLKGAVRSCSIISLCNKKGARCEAEMQPFKYARLNIFCRFILGPVGGLILIVNKPRTISSVYQRTKQHFLFLLYWIWMLMSLLPVQLTACHFILYLRGYSEHWFQCWKSGHLFCLHPYSLSRLQRETVKLWVRTSRATCSNCFALHHRPQMKKHRTADSARTSTTGIL